MPIYSIERFTGELDGAQGPSHKNRYEVNVNLPFAVPYTVSKERLNLFCDSLVFPGHRLTTTEFMSAANPLRIPSSFTTEEMQFSFLLNRNHEIFQLFSVWMEKIIDSFSYVLAYKKDLIADWEVWQLDKSNNRTVGVKLFNVFPVQSDPIDFANSSTNDIQRFNLSIVYDRRRILQ